MVICDREDCIFSDFNNCCDKEIIKLDKKGTCKNYEKNMSIVGFNLRKKINE